MISKFMYKFWLILLAISINSFGIDPEKRFGCHNLSSVEKIANIECKNNELLRNLMQCMRDTDTYNEKNLDISRKLNDDFVQTAEGMSWPNRIYRNLLTRCFDFSYAALAVSGISLTNPDNKNTKKYATTTASFFSVILFSRLTNMHINYVRRRTENKKLPIAKRILSFADTLIRKK